MADAAPASPTYEDYVAAQARIVEDNLLTSKFEIEQITAAQAVFESTGLKNALVKLNEIAEKMPAGAALTAIRSLTNTLADTQARVEQQKYTLTMRLNPPTPITPMA